LTTLAYGGGTYGPQFTETRTYNNLMQLTQLTNGGVNMQYIYPTGQNNGRVSQTIDGVLNETVNYTYDMWNRLITATATNGAWGESYTFDNFGNLTGKTPTVGTAPTLSVSANPATNQQSGNAYDANGNSLGATYYPNVWDVENRLINTQTTANQPTTYSYDPWGRRVWKEIAGVGTDPNGNPNPPTYEIYFYGATGQKLETYSGSYWSGPSSSLEGINIYFGGKLLQSKGVWVATDRLGSVRANSNGEAMSYWPYGEERTTTANGREKFATYTRDATGQDYAEQRYYNSNMGSFWSPDPGGIRTAATRNPLSWNRYAYTSGNPIGRFDPHGRDDCDPDEDCSCDDPCDPCTDAAGVRPADSCGLPLPVGPPPAPTPVTCTVTVEQQSAIFSGDPFKHTFTVVQYSNQTPQQATYLEAEPISGYLNAEIDIGHPYNTTTPYTAVWGPTTESASFCDKLIALAENYKNDVVKYNYKNPFAGPNSNSWTHSLLAAAGLANGPNLSNLKFPGWSNTGVPFN
jgi:RHS repeat-associated protein